MLYGIQWVVCILLAPRLGSSSPWPSYGMWWHALPVSALACFRGRQDHLDGDRLLRCWLSLGKQVGPVDKERLL